MPDSIKERIEKQIPRRLVDQLEVDASHVQRFDDTNEAVADGSGNLPDVWYVVSFGEEDPLEEEGASLGTEAFILPCTIDIHLRKGGKPGGMTIAEWANQEIAKVRKALRSDAQVTEEGTDEPLAIDTMNFSSFPPAAVTGGREYVAGVECEIHYRHADADPYTAVG